MSPLAICQWRHIAARLSLHVYAWLCAYVHLSVSPFLHFQAYYPEWNWHILMKHITFTQYQVHMTLMTFSRSWVQSSRSYSDSHGNLELDRSWATEGMRTKTNTNISHSLTLGFEGHGLKLRVTDNIFQTKHFSRGGISINIICLNFEVHPVLMSIFLNTAQNKLFYQHWRVVYSSAAFLVYVITKPSLCFNGKKTCV